MDLPLSRRRFVTGTVAAAGLATLGPIARGDEFKVTMKKAMIGPAGEDHLKKLKDAGFDGVESSNTVCTPERGEQIRKAADELGMRVHSMLYGWANFNDEATIPGQVDAVAARLKSTSYMGGGALLLVPCRVGGMPIPQPWEFDIEFDEKTGHVTRVVDGDNSRFQKYIEAQNHATDCTKKAVQQLIPVAEEAGVVIALENVWNNLWVKPAVFTNLVASFDSPWVGAYFDIGNHVKYAMPELWIRELGNLIVRCHVKDFTMKPDGRPGGFVPIRDGSVDWPLVRRELDKLDRKEMWMTIEASPLPLEENSRRLDLIVAGK